jgi:hypothetical protein
MAYNPKYQWTCETCGTLCKWRQVVTAVYAEEVEHAKDINLALIVGLLAGAALGAVAMFLWVGK